MRYLLIPVKDLTRAKQRLAEVMSQEERTALAWAMLENALAAAAQSRRADRIAIVTLYPPAVALAERYGMEVILETEQISESASVDFGAREAMKRGATAVLRLPIDLPSITAADIDEVFAAANEAAVVLVPSRDGTGTNAILRSPPDLFPSHFGAGSFRKHLREAELAQAACRVLDLPRIALDIDEPQDLRELLERGTDSPIREFLMNLGVEERLRSAGW
ncbi:MAG: 2-phospho-L-lactate guanylyltransferase [Blastocatellia bacterium]|nr:2-phospho-L-lactate guanylyltransferase [Blastocatellia bacterium]